MVLWDTRLLWTARATYHDARTFHLAAVRVEVQAVVVPKHDLVARLHLIDGLEDSHGGEVN